MIVFLDTEFTQLGGNPLLLSIGIVGGDGTRGEFYVEVTDTARLHAASAFALNVVLPQLGKVPGAACTYEEAGTRVFSYFAALVKALPRRETLAVAYECDLDWVLLERAMQETKRRLWPPLSKMLRPVNVYNVPGFAAGETASRAYFETQRFALFARHHALCDARALRIAYEAAKAASSSARSTVRQLDAAS
ncbi:MAG: hypothetical protein ABI460_14745 [Caldimonas sp.]